LAIKGFKNMAEANPKLLKSIPFFERLWVRELTTNAYFLLLAISVNVISGEILNAKDLEKLKGFYSVVPDDLKKEMAFNFLSNAEILHKIFETKGFKTIEKFANLEKRGEVWGKIYNTVFKDTIEQAGGVYTELPGEKFIAVKDTAGNKIDNKSIKDTVDNKSIKDTVGNKSIKDTVGNNSDEKELRELGYVTVSELEDNVETDDIVKLNGVYWFKVKK
jgi:hypothetical protein